MRFTVDVKTYVIEFQHQHKQVQVQRDGAVHTIKSTYPYTAALIREVVEGKKREDWPILYTEEVGCCTLDTYSRQAGNLFALKALNAQLQDKVSKEFREKMWSAYLNRKSTTKKAA